MPLINVGRRASDDRDAVERWRFATHTKESQSVIAPVLQCSVFDLTSRVPRYRDVSCTPQWDSRRFVLPRCDIIAVPDYSQLISTIESPTDEDLSNPGSLFTSRTLPPLSSHPLPRPQPYPLLRPSEWTSPSHRRDSGGHFRRLQGDGRPPYPVLPLATSSSEDSHSQQYFAPHYLM